MCSEITCMIGGTKIGACRFRSHKVVVTSCCNWTEVLSGLYISSGLLNAHQGKEKPYKSV